VASAKWANDAANDIRNRIESYPILEGLCILLGNSSIAASNPAATASV